MAVNEDFHRQIRRTGFMTFAFAAGLVFGVILLIGGDWIPGGIIVAATLTGLAVEIPVIRKLRGHEPPKPAG